jgi:hypothetical protein
MLPVFDPYSYANNYLQRQALGVAPRLARHPPTQTTVERLSEFGVKSSRVTKGSKAHVEESIRQVKKAREKKPKRNIFQVSK